MINQLLAPQQIVRAPGLVKPVLASLKRDDDLAIADLAYLVGRLRGLSTGAVEFRAVPAVPGMVQPPGFTTEISVLHPDPTASAIFRALRNGSALPAAGTELINTPTSPANIPVAVLDDGSGDVAGQVADILSTSGFDVSPGIIPLGGSGVRVDGPMIVYTRGHEEEAQVVAQYLPGSSSARCRDRPRGRSPWSRHPGSVLMPSAAVARSRSASSRTDEARASPAR